MKNILLFSAIALITVFAVTSCNPDAETTSYDWSATYEAINASSTQPAKPSFVSTGEWWQDITSKKQLIIKFPLSADIFKNISTEELEKFLTVYVYTAPTTAITDGGTSVLGATVDYTFHKRLDDDIYININKDTTNTDNLVIKIDGSAYTYGNGNKMDVDGNKVGGEAVYDDLYLVVSGGFTAPGNIGWDVSLPLASTLFNTAGFTTTAAQTNAATFTIVTLSLPARSGTMSSTSEAGKKAYQEVAELVASGIKLQKLSGTTWSDEATATYDTAVNVTQIRFNNVQFDHKAHYRIRWSGDANLVTPSKYFGIEQRVAVVGVTGYSPVVGGTTGFKTKYAYTEQVSPSMKFLNTLIYEELPYSGDITSTVAYSTGFDGSGIMLRVIVPILGPAGSYVGLSELDLENFKKAFKIVYFANNASIDGSNVNNFLTTSQKMFDIDYTAVSFGKTGLIPSTATNNTTYFNVIDITLDSSFRLYVTGTNRNDKIYFLINDKLQYTGTTPVRAFGNLDNYYYENFRMYDVPALALPTSYPPVLN